ncbi:FOG: TPR repeat [Gluconobacter frateurii NBRC 103465]|nr:FOG: TPR repeat [Gluconobacter frateurii NBRC 103465]
MIRWMTIGRRWLMAGAVLLCTPVFFASATPADSPAPAASAPSGQTPPPVKNDSATSDSGKAHPHHKTVQERLVETEKALALAGNDKDARKLADQAETLRNRSLTGAVRMLLTDSQDALGKHDFQSAEDDLTSAITLQPDQPILRRYRAAIRSAAGDNNGAIADLGIAIQADPGDATAWGMLAESERDRHEPEAALRAYKQMMQLDPHAPDADKQLKILQKEKDGQED